MARQGDIAKFKARISQLQRKRFQIVQYSEDPPRAKLRGRIDDDRTRRKNATQSRFNVPGAVWEFRQVWVDEAGELHDEEIDPSGGFTPDTTTGEADATEQAQVGEPAVTVSEASEKKPRHKAAVKTSE
ncbi:MAG: hypothetical protein M3173_07350 [Chloroflexota bacterium]|nr:hypothetical protein [Chloroflexota bacterium]